MVKLSRDNLLFMANKAINSKSQDMVSQVKELSLINRDYKCHLLSVILTFPLQVADIFVSTGYVAPRYEREVILENAEAEALTGSYQKYIYNLGECCGCLRAWLPICCVEYPFIEIE